MGEERERKGCREVGLTVDVMHPNAIRRGILNARKNLVRNIIRDVGKHANLMRLDR